MPTNHVSPKEPTGYYNHVYQPSHVHQRPPENHPNPANVSSRPFMKERIIFEHSYYNRVENNSSNTTAIKSLGDGNSHRTLMAPCTNKDIPLLTTFGNQFDNTTDSQIESSVLTNETVVALFEEVDKNHEIDISIEQTPINDYSNRKELDTPPLAELHETDSPSVVSVNTHTEQDDDECFPISSPSINEFEIDLDTEKESLASPPLSLTGDNEQLHSRSFCVSLPLSKVSLPTSILLKPPKKDLSPAQSKDICSVAVAGRPTGKERVQTRESLAKQQNNTIQLRNRALPRNLYLFASRKSSPKVNNAVESNDNESDDDGVDKNVSTSDDSTIVIENKDMMHNDIDESTKECTEEISVNDSIENDYDIRDKLRIIRTHSESPPSTSNTSQAKVCL